MVYTLRIPVMPFHTRPVRKPGPMYNDDAMLATLDLLKTLSCLQQLQEMNKKPEKWVKRIKIPQCDPESISLKVNGEKAHIRAVRETGDSENGESTEIRRTFVLPRTLDTEKIDCKVGVNGILTLEAPFRIEKTNEKTVPNETRANSEGKEEQSKATEKHDQKDIEKETLPAVWKRRFCLKGFNKETLKVSVRDNLVTIEGEMEMSESDDSSLTMTKIISLPTNVDVDNLKCRMNSEGTLELEAPFMNDDDDDNNKPTVSNEKEETVDSVSNDAKDEISPEQKTSESEVTRPEDDREQRTETDIAMSLDDNNTEDNNTEDNNIEDNNTEDNNTEDNNIDDNNTEDNNIEDDEKQTEGENSEEKVEFTE
ncbi:hypothetical protein FSP39_017102 [Pinctada imbricata]|uniref:SHSP domain-containing protein n=1 Tax=Pinctada imbricata TaxID=66713 RepID=A0AA89C435_PINIB|nr:hypothetical protein FSP39_017102 [Pinctada imbricata]